MMQLHRPKNLDANMTNDGAGSSGQWVQQESTSASLKHGRLAVNTLNNNISVQTGEEFSVAFLQDRATPRTAPALPDMAQTHGKRIGFNSNQKCATGYDEFTRTLGLQRMDSAKTDLASAKGSTAKVENGAYKDDGIFEHECRKGTGEIFSDQACSGPRALLINESESSRGHQPFGLGVSDASQSGKIKFLCSLGGKILPRPSDAKLRYVGGETRIISIRKNISWEELVKKTSGICNQPHTIKYQLPGEDLDALISVSSDEDLQNMIDECHGIETLGGSSRLRIFLIPLSESENTSTFDDITIQQSNPDYQYVAAVNGIVDPTPQKNCNGLCWASEESELKINLNCNRSFHGNSLSSLHPLEIKEEHGVSHLTPCMNESQTCIKPSNQNLPFSPMPILQLDLSQTSEPVVVSIQKCNSSRDFAAPSMSDRNDSNLNEFCFQKTVLKGRTFHSEKQISDPAEPVGHLLGSNATNRSNSGIPHAFSDSQLHEHGEMSSSNPLNFANPQFSSCVGSAAFQEKPVQLQENIDSINSQAQIKLLNVDPTASQVGMDMLKCSLGSEPVSKVEHTHGDANYIDEKCQSAKEDLNNCGFVVQNHKKENSLSHEVLNGFDVKDPLVCQGRNLYENKPPTICTVYMNKLPNGSCQPISILDVDPTIQYLQVSDGMVPASTIKLKPFIDTKMEQPQNIKLEKSPTDLIIKSQRDAKSQQHVSMGIQGGKQESNISSAKNSEVAGMTIAKEQSLVENSPIDLEDGQAKKPILTSSGELHPSAVCDGAGLNANLCKSTMVHNLYKDAGIGGEVSLLDYNFVSYSDLKFEKPRYEERYNDKQMQEDACVSIYNEKKQLESVDDVKDVQSSNAAVPHVATAVSSQVLSQSVAESIIPELDFEDDRLDDGDKDTIFTDAMIAEMEAETYGLQTIKNADLEELQELGSGTYGTVYYGKWRGTDVAIKRIKKSCFSGRSSEQERLTKDFWREAQILSNLHHPNVVAFYGVVPDGAGGTLATVTEFMANGSLSNVLLKKDRSLDRHRKLIIAMDAAFGMEYLHLKNIVHFDLKCDNLLVNLRDPQRPICKVGDFGLSRIKRNTLVTGGVRGTLPWMAPELLNGSSSRVSEKVDVFSFGITMWEILTGEEPYADMHCGAIIGGIVKNTLRPPIPKHCDPEWRKLMEQCWSLETEARPSFTEITNRLRSMSVALQSKGAHNNDPRRDHPKLNMPV
ncbi:hypothetical protein LguiB_000460 [Lonicera macranthoides]